MKKKRLLAVLLTAALLVPNFPELLRVSASETDVTDTLYEEGALLESTDSTGSGDGSGMLDTAETGAEDDALSEMLQAVPMTESGNDLAAYAVSYDASHENSGLELTVGNALPMTGKWSLP